MANIIKSVSVTEDESSFLKDYNLSPTQLLKEKLWEMKGMVKTLVQAKINRMSKIIQEQAATIEKLENVATKQRLPGEEGR